MGIAAKLILDPVAAPMPEALKRFIEGLTWHDADLIAEWLDETPHPEVEMVRMIAMRRITEIALTPPRVSG